MLDESFALKAIAASVLLSESPGEGLVRLAYRGDAPAVREKHPRFQRRSAWLLPGGSRPIRAYLPPGSGCCAGQGTRANIKKILENGSLPAPSSQPADEREHGSTVSQVSKWFP
jgi:hypothetical protein